MELLVHLNTRDTMGPSNRIHEAKEVINRLRNQGVTQFTCLPNENDPTAIKFEYNGRNTAGIRGESARKEYNGLDERDPGTFVSMDQIIETDLQKHTQYSKKDGHPYAKIPIQPRTRAQIGNPATPTGKPLVRTINANNAQGSWYVLLRNWLLNKHEANQTLTPNDPHEIQAQLGLDEKVDIINNTRISPLNMESQNQLNNSITNNNIPPLSTNNINWNNPDNRR